MKNPYEVLGVTSAATDDEIKSMSYIVGYYKDKLTPIDLKNLEIKQNHIGEIDFYMNRIIRLKKILKNVYILMKRILNY